MTKRRAPKPSRLLLGGTTELVEVDLGDRRLEIEQVAGVGALIQASLLAGSLTAPHWAVLWPSARALARLVFSGPSLEGRRVIEVGAGLGAAGLAAAARGASVLITDFEPRAVELVRRNAARNGLRVEARVLDFFDPSTELGTFDGILAADVMYDDGMLAGVLRFVRRHLASDGLAAIADPMRVMPGGVCGAARLHGLVTSEHIVRPGPSIIGGVTVYGLRFGQPARPRRGDWH